MPESHEQLLSLSLAEASELVRARKVSPLDLTRACLSRIQAVDPKLNAFITLTAERALAAARTAEEELRRGRWTGPLHGVPIALKDIVDTAGVARQRGSSVYADRVPAEDAEVVKLLEAAARSLLGKLNLHEFASAAPRSRRTFGPRTTRGARSLDGWLGGGSRPPSPRGSATARSAPTPAGRSASRPRTAASSASSRRSAASAARRRPARLVARPRRPDGAHASRTPR